MSNPISFSITHSDTSHLKLIELPPDVLQSLESGAPQILELKANETNDGDEGRPSFAVVCTQDKTYHIRQQQTSNSIFIVKPSYDATNKSKTIGISSVAKCGATLEPLLSKEPAEPYLQIMLLPYSGPDQQKFANGQDGLSKQQIYSNIPLSTAQIDHQWDDLCAFEHLEVSHLPSPSCLLKVWQSVLCAALAEDINILDVSLQSRLWEALSEEGIPQALFVVILTRARSSDCAIWLAKLLLQTASRNSLSVNEFNEALRENLPTHASKPDSLNAYEPFANLTNPHNISLKPTSLPVISGPSISTRIWHDRFKKKR